MAKRETLDIHRHVRFSRSLDNDVIRASDEMNVLHSDAVRALVRAGLHNRNIDSDRHFIEALEKLRHELAKIGGNINQIAYRLNATDTMNETDLKIEFEHIKPVFSEVVTLVKRVRNEFIDQS